MLGPTPRHLVTLSSPTRASLQPLHLHACIYFSCHLQLCVLSSPMTSAEAGGIAAKLSPVSPPPGARLPAVPVTSLPVCYPVIRWILPSFQLLLQFFHYWPLSRARHRLLGPLCRPDSSSLEMSGPEEQLD